MSRIYLFNPDCEMAIANGSPYYMPSASILKMIGDLSYLPAYFAEKEDYILISEKPDTRFLDEKLQNIGLQCKTVTMDETPNLPLSGVAPWGWSPRICHLLKNIPGCRSWNPNDKELYSRRKALECLLALQDKNIDIEKDITPSICHSIAEIAELVGEGHYIAKAPWSSSGRGLLSLSGQPTVKEKEWLHGILRKQKYITIEKRLDKIHDFALEFYIRENREIDFWGYSSFTTGTGGEYQGNFVGEQQQIEHNLVGYIGNNALNLLKSQIIETLSEQIAPHYTGALGVDMMIYRNSQGSYCVQPCVEINLRYNMGIVALFLSRRFIFPGSHGQFTIEFFPRDGEALTEHHRRLQILPPIYQNHQLSSGYMNLTPVTPATRFIACLQIQPNRE